MQKLQSLFYLTTALYVSGVTIAHLQEHKTIVTTASGNRYTVLLSAAIVEEYPLRNLAEGFQFLSCRREVTFSNFDCASGCSDSFHGFYQSLQKVCGILPQTMSR
jgi:hypothetical protein